MSSPSRRARLTRYAVALGCLWVSGCMTNLERNLDLVLSPGAVDNALVLPYSPVAGWTQFLARLFHR